MKDWYEGTLLEEKISGFNPTDINYITGFKYYIGYNDSYEEISFLEIDFLIKKSIEIFNLKMKFHAVSSLNLMSFGEHYNQLMGFSIIDLGDKGFEKDKRFLIEDYENDIVNFHCAALEVVSLEEV